MTEGTKAGWGLPGWEVTGWGLSCCVICPRQKLLVTLFHTFKLKTSLKS